AHGDYALPVNVPANQFLNFEGKKFSKSRGWGIEQHEYLEAFKDFPNKEDALRYALLRNLPENKDSDFKWDEFVEYHDKELADNLGNFLNRVVALTNKYFDGKAPEVAFQSADYAIVQSLIQRFDDEIKAFNFKNAVQVFLELSTYGNTYFQEQAPWKLYKANPEDPQIAAAMFHVLQVATVLSVLAEPFIPFTAQRIRELLNLPALQVGDVVKLHQHFSEETAPLAAGHQIGEPQILFAKIHDRKDTSRLEIINTQKEKLQAILDAEAEQQRPELKPEIQFEDFTKLDIRTGMIVEAEKVAKAK
ncbi:MAG: class I tRNA ligase family protein, partial [Bacteroidota bacterium]